MASPLLDFKKFKHVKSDDNSTILEHQDGHQLTLNHKALSKDNQAQLKAMQGLRKDDKKENKAAEPKSREDKGHGAIVAKAEGGEIQKYAEGDDEVSKITSGEGGQEQNMSQPSAQPPVSININAQPGQQPQAQVQPPAPTPTPAPAPQAPQEPIPQTPGASGSWGEEPQAPQQSMEQPQPNSSETPSSSPQSQASGPSQPTEVPKEDIQQPTFETHKEAVKQEMSKELQDWQNDQINGHIKPKTMHDLLWKNDDGSDKGLLGKIGTVFGLLLSGAGSGLTHQPNVLLSMLQKQIDNDIMSQTQSKSNAQNLFKINQQQALNDAQIKFQQGPQTKLTEAQAKAAETDANVKAFAMTRMMYNIKAFHEMAQLAQKYPVGSPQRAQADQQLAMMYPLIQGENLNIQDKAASASALANFGGQNGDNRQGLLMSGQGPIVQFREERSLPGVSGLANRPIPEETRKQILAMDTLDNKGKDVLTYVKKHSGTWNPKTRAVAEQKIEEMKNFYNDSIKGGALTQGRLGWYDEQFAKNPTDILSQVMGSSAKLKEMVDSNATRRDLQIKNFFPNSKGKESGSEPKEGSVSKSKSGKPIEFRNGKWNYK